MSQFSEQEPTRPAKPEPTASQYFGVLGKWAIIAVLGFMLYQLLLPFLNPMTQVFLGFTLPSLL